MPRRLIATVVVLAVLAAACGGDKPYIERNLDVLQSLPKVPDTETLEVTSNAYYEDEGGPVAGYTTNAVYHVVSDLSARDIVDFYIEELGDGWDYETEEVPVTDAGGAELGTVLLADFRNGSRGVQVNTDGMLDDGLPTFELSIDHRRYR